MKKIYLALLLLIVISKTFSQNYTILGNASSLGGCNCFRLTPDADDQAGAIFQNQTINLNNSFDFTFNVFLGCNGSNGADGIVFVLTSNPNGLGNHGEGLGYAGGNQPYSLAVEFDTWQNGSVSDPSYDHIGIESGGLYSHNVAGAVSALISQGNIDNCAWHTVRVVWDVNTNTYSVYFDGVLRQQIIIPNIVNTYFGGNPIVNWGWSGATGGGSNDQQVCVLNTSNWVAGINYQSCNLTMQFNDISTSSLGSVQSWAWTFGDGATSTLQNPVHTYASTGTYTATLTITDISGCSNTYSHIVTINPPIIMAPTITPPPCNGGANGGISIVPSGGFGPAAGYGGYLYHWSNNTTQTTLVGAGAGTYTLTITDGVCTSTAQYTVSQPTALTATTSHTDAPCGGNGTATIAISGGTPAYTGINWAGFPASNGVPLSMPAGFWIADFHDANGCSALLQYTETISALPCGITTSLTSTNVSCWGGSNGTATLTVTGGSGGNVAGWTTVGNVFTKTGLVAGTYNYTYIDANPALNFSFTVTIMQPGAAMVASLATVNMSCATSNDGQALASVTSGGTTPYIYAWSRGTVNGAVSSSLSAGVITVTVTDASGCTATASGTITGPPVLTLSVTHVDDSCYQSHTGSATANVSGGNPPYTFYWSNISSAQTNLSLGIGSYTVTVTDNKGCSITGSASISQPGPFTHTLTSQNITCFGNATGSILVTPSGGIPALTYIWSPATASGNNPTGLAAGQYHLTLSDATNCQIIDSVVITQPASGLSVTTSHTDVTCFGANNGTLTIAILGGTPPYNYGGIPVPANITIPGLPDSTYSGSIADATGCSVAVSETIAEPALLSLSETHVNVACNAGNTGSIDVTVTGGTGPYTYNWGGAITTEDRTGLIAGTYVLTCTDTHSCSATISVVISEPTALSVTETHVNVLCNAGSTGSINITPSGGTSPYTYLWNDAVATQNRTNIPTATYTVTVSDNNLCTVSISIIITQPGVLTVTTSHTNVTCNGASNGTLTINVSGGTAPYNFGGIPVSAGTTVIPGLRDSTYSGSIADVNGCSVVVSETITQPGPQSLQVLSVTDNICNGGNIGAISVNFVNPTGAVTYNWNPGGVQPASQTGLIAGVYNITATDQNTCTVTANATVNQPAAPVMTVTVVDAVCFGGNGSATANPVGGGPYTYIWSVAGTTQTITPPDGNYTVSAADVNLCNQTAAFTINQPTDISIGETHTNLKCFGDANGTITLTPSGGTGAIYTYNWNPNVSTTSAASMLIAGSYSITVTDQANCTKPITVVLSQPALPVTLGIASTNISCFGLSNGSITLTATGGTGTYTYTWSPNVSSTNSATGLSPNTYTVTVADANNCSLAPSITLTQPNQPLTLIPDSTNLTCFQSNDGTASVAVSGGTFPYLYAWNPNVNSTNSASGLSALIYTVTVTDNNGCTNNVTFNITQPLLLTGAETHVDVKCFGDTNGAVFITASGGTAGYTYIWNPNASTVDSAVNIAAGNYTVTITDTNNCTTVQTATVSQPQALSITPAATDVPCNGGNTGSISSNPSGGTPVYSFAATDGVNNFNSSSGQFTTLFAGNYSITVTDQNQCTASGNAIVNEPVALSSVVDTFAALCNNTPTGRLLVSVTGGVPAFHFSLSNGDANTTGIFNSLSVGTYQVSITDGNGCTFNDVGTITQPDSLLVNVTPTPVEVKMGETLQLTTTTNQTGVLTYAWTPTMGLSCSDCANPVFSGVYSQPYVVVVTNQGGCKGMADFVVTVIPDYSVFIPNVFTPDGNGTNDEWQIFGNMNAFKQVEVGVFNRWGEKVFESNDINFKWDGTYRGEKVPPGVYVYTAKFVWLNNHADSKYHGTVTVLH